MKKRLLSALLALALVFVLLPTTALADTTPVTDENVKINGTAVTVGNDISLGEGNGTYSYDKSTRTLTLNNATITATGSNIGIDFCDTTNYVTYSVILTGENTVTSNNIAIETTPNTNLTFTGGGNLKAITNGYYQAIRVYGTLTIDNSTLIAESSAYTATTVIWTLAMTGNNAKLEISNKSAANIVAGTAGPASKNIDWSNYQFTTGSYSGDALTESDPEVCSWGTLNEYLGFPTKKYSQYICIAKRTIPALTKTSDVLIAGENAVVGQWTDIPAATGTGSYYYDADEKELTLKDVNIASSSIINGIQFTKDGTYTINLVGTNTMSGFSTGISANSADQYVSNINITITGAGSLEVSTTSYAIAMNKGNLKFENTGEIKLTTSNPSKNRNVLSVSGNITITDMDKYSVTGITQTGSPNVTGETVTLSAASHLKGYQNPDDTWTYLKTITIASKPSETYYNDKAMKCGETRTAGSGTISCDENGAITLNGATAGTLEFRSSADSTLVLEGTSTLSSIVTTQKGLTISGSGSLTVGSIRVPNNTTTSNSPSLTIDGAKVTAGTPTSTTSAVEVKGDLTVTNGSLTATSKSDSVPTVQVGGNASFTGSTVTITNNSTTQGERYKDSYEVSSALHVNGAITISGGTVTAEAKAGGNAIRAVGNITVSNDATVTAKNNSQYFNAITAGSATGGEVNTLYNLIVSGENTRITATNAHDNNLTYGGAINAYIKNANEGHYLQVGTDTKAIAPNVNTTVKNNSLTITRGDEVARTESPVVIAGTTLLNDTYYTITNGSKVAEGTDSNYNAFYDSETKTLKLNNAQISHSFANENSGGRDGAIIFKEFENYFIELSGENTISSTNTYAINCHRPDRTLTIKNAAEAENAKLTLTSNWMVICSIGGLNIQSDVTMVNTKEAGYLMYVNDTFSFDGYNAYASVNASGSPLVEYTVPTSGDKDAGYQYLRITKETLETGGGSTHQHTYGGWKSDATYHWQECTDPNCPDPTKGITNKASHIFSNGACTVCGYRGQTEEHHFGTEWISDEEYHWHKCTDEGCDAISGKAPHEWTGWLVNDDRPEVHAQRCNCGYLGSTHSTLKYVAINGEQHQKQCPVDGCGYKIESSTTAHVYAEGSNICTDCGYNKSAPCDHTGDRAYTNNGDGTHKVTCKACGATIVEKQSHEFGPTGACIYCGATQSGGDPTPDNPGTIVIIRPAEEEKPAQQPNPPAPMTWSAWPSPLPSPQPSAPPPSCASMINCPTKKLPSRGAFLLTNPRPGCITFPW